MPREDRNLKAQVFAGFGADRFRAATARACKGAGVPVFSPHDLRHRRATLWHLSRVPVAEAFVWLGHSAAEHLQTYAHVVLDRTEIDIPKLLESVPDAHGVFPPCSPAPGDSAISRGFEIPYRPRSKNPQARSQGGLAASRRRSCVSTPGHTVERRGLGCGPGVRPLGTAAASPPASPHPSDRASTPVEFLAEPSSWRACPLQRPDGRVEAGGDVRPRSVATIGVASSREPRCRSGRSQQQRQVS